MELREMLEEMGLTEMETKVYLALLELGPSLAGRISRKTGIHRRNIYDITERLIKKGLIGYILKNNRRVFEAVNPERFLDVIKEREESFLEVLPRLKMLYEKTKEKQETNFYSGKEGLRSVFEDQLDDKNGEILILGASKNAFEVLPFYFKWYDQLRVKRKIKVKIIASENLGKNVPLSEIRYIPEKYANPLAVNIYKDKVALIFWKKENPFAVVIKEKEVADSYKNYFDLVWKIARRRE